MISKAELAELYREDDRLRAEHREWLAERQAQAQALVQKSDDDDLLYRTHDENAPLDAPAADGEVSDAAEEFVFTGEQFDCLAAGLDAALKHEEARVRSEQKAAIAPLQRELDFLRGRLDALLTTIGQRAKEVPDENFNAKSGDVIDLPRGFIRRRSDAA
jgi:hypothetical protein